MWRRYADELYAVLVLIVFTVEAAALGLLTVFFVLRLAGVASDAEGLVIAGVAVTAVAVMALAVYVVGYHGVSGARERRGVERAAQWTERWVRVVFFGDRAPRPPLAPEAVQALLDLREVTKGSEGERIEGFLARYHIGKGYLARLDVRRSRSPLTFGFRPRRTAVRLEALEALAKARVPEALGTLLALCDDPEPAARRMALRGAARTVARLDGERRERGAAAFVAMLYTAQLPVGSVEGSLALLEDAAPTVVRGILAPGEPVRRASGWVANRRGTRPLDEPPATTPTLLVARAIETVGRLNLHDLVPDVVRYLGHEDAEVRAAALRTLAELQVLPDEAIPRVRAAFEDPTEFVRLQAARCAVLLPDAEARERLGILMGDPSWWIRRSAARSLMALGPRGAHLAWVARTHRDRYAREMAIQVLLDAGHMDAADARSLLVSR